MRSVMVMALAAVCMMGCHTQSETMKGQTAMQVLAHFDNAAAAPHQVDGEAVTFDLRQSQVLNVMLVDPPTTLTVIIQTDRRQMSHVLGQGLIVSHDGQTFQAVPWSSVDREAARLTAVVTTGGRSTQVTLNYPYGRDQLDRLFADVHGGRGRWDMLRSGWRQVPVFRIGDDQASIVHWIIAGEDGRETGGHYAADEMVRCLADGRLSPPPGTQVCVVPVVSPYSLTQPNPCYTDSEGNGLYAAATWTAATPPPEFLLLRQEVDRAIAARRLGLLLTIHCWHALRPNSGMETILTAGSNRLSTDRAEWASQTMATLLRDVPVGQYILAEKIWHPGLARDWSLAARNVISFRIEVTTAGASVEQFRQSGRALLANIAAVGNWRPVYAEGE